MRSKGETDVGREMLTISRDGSFTQGSLVPVSVITGTYGTAQSNGQSAQVTATTEQETIIHVLDLSFEELKMAPYW